MNKINTLYFYKYYLPASNVVCIFPETSRKYRLQPSLREGQNPQTGSQRQRLPTQQPRETVCLEVDPCYGDKQGGHSGSIYPNFELSVATNSTFSIDIPFHHYKDTVVFSS